VTLYDLSGSGMMLDLSLDIYIDSNRIVAGATFFIPEPVYMRVSIDTMGVPAAFYPQVCYNLFL